MLDVRSAAVGRMHGALVTASGAVYTWGEGRGGKLGLGHDQDQPAPQRLEAGLRGQRVVAVACGDDCTAAVTDAGAMFMWGRLAGAGRPQLVPLPIRGELSSRVITKVGGFVRGHLDKGATGSAGVLAGATQRSLAGAAPDRRSAGDRQLLWRLLGSQGAINVAQHPQPAAPGCLLQPSFARVALGFLSVLALQVSCGPFHCAAVSADGALFTWGEGFGGKLGLGDQSCRAQPALVQALAERQVRGGRGLVVQQFEREPIGFWPSCATLPQAGHADCSKLAGRTARWLD